MSALDRMTRHATTGLVLDADETREVLEHIAGLKAQRDELLEALLIAHEYNDVCRFKLEDLDLIDAAIANATGA